MIGRRSGWLSFILLASTQACLASKNDIRLLQDELRVSRAAEAHADSARAAQGDSLRRLLLENAHQMDNLFAEATQASRVTAESLAVLSNRLVDFSANTHETLDQLGRLVTSVASLNQAQANRIAGLQQSWEDLQQKMPVASPAPGGTAPGGGAGDQGGGPPPPATLMGDALNKFNSQACSTARNEYSDFLQYYPTNDRAPEAQYDIAETFNCEGNPTGADSVYLVVVAKYPGTDYAANALFQHAKALCKAGKGDDAKVAFQKIVSDYPTSTVRPDAITRLNQPDPCAQ